MRYSFPGDQVMVEADGSITLLGRGSSCISTGGAKVGAVPYAPNGKAHYRAARVAFDARAT